MSPRSSSTLALPPSLRTSRSRCRSTITSRVRRRWTYHWFRDRGRRLSRAGSRARGLGQRWRCVAAAVGGGQGRRQGRAGVALHEGMMGNVVMGSEAEMVSLLLVVDSEEAGSLVGVLDSYALTILANTV